MPAPDKTQRSTQFFALGVSLCDQAIEMGGQKFTPDETKAYLLMELSQAMPCVNFYGEMVHPATVAAAHQTMLHQPLNYNHLMAFRNPKEIAHDRILGSIVAVELTQKADSKIPADKSNAQAIRAVASVFKHAQGADRIIGKHNAGRVKYAVSMELAYTYADSGFLVSKPAVSQNRSDNPSIEQNETPSDILEVGYYYVPMHMAPDDLLATRDFKRSRMKDRRADGGYVGKWNGSDVYMLMGGLSGPVHYDAVAVCEQGAQPEAEITRLLASVNDETEDDLRPIRMLSGILEGAK